MADEPQGPGWWQASDGKWYPPELHPSAGSTAQPQPFSWRDAPGETTTSPGWASPSASTDAPTSPPGTWPTSAWTPQPAAPPARRGRRNAIIGIAVAIVVSVVVAVFALGTKTDKVKKTGKTASVTTEASTPARSTLDVAAATGPTVSASKAGASLTLPDGWVGASTEDGIDGVGARLFPDDADLAQTLQSRMAILPRAVVIFAADAEAARAHAPFLPNINVILDSSVPASYSLSEAGKAEAKGIELFGSVKQRDEVSFDAVDAVRITYEAKGGAFAGFSYVYKAAGKFWVATYAFTDSSAQNRALADASAATFVAG